MQLSAKIINVFSLNDPFYINLYNKAYHLQVSIIPIDFKSMIIISKIDVSGRVEQFHGSLKKLPQTEFRLIKSLLQI